MKTVYIVDVGRFSPVIFQAEAEESKGRWNIVSTSVLPPFTYARSWIKHINKSDTNYFVSESKIEALFVLLDRVSVDIAKRRQELAEKLEYVAKITEAMK